MWKCPVCDKENETLLCGQCGFDGSMDYERYPTVDKVTAQAISGQKTAYNSMMQDYYRCTGCGGRQFYLDQKRMALVCIPCGKAQDIPSQIVIPQAISDDAFLTVPPGNSILSTPTSPIHSFISAGAYNTSAIKNDGTILITGQVFAQLQGRRWEKIVAFSVGDRYIAGLKDDGHVVATGANSQLNSVVSQWENMVSIDIGSNHIVGLRADGTVDAFGSNLHKQCDVSSWANITAIAAGNNHTVGLQADGTVLLTEMYCRAIPEWKNIIAIAAGNCFTLGLRADGTVVASTNFLQNKVANWKNIVAIAAGESHVVGLEDNGAVVATGDNSFGQCDVSTWENIVAIAAGHTHTVGLMADGTMVATGDNTYGQCNISDWKDIRIPTKQ